MALIVNNSNYVEIIDLPIIEENGSTTLITLSLYKNSFVLYKTVKGVRLYGNNGNKVDIPFKDTIAGSSEYGSSQELYNWFKSIGFASGGGGGGADIPTEWGNIEGDIVNQIDLINLVNTKANTADLGDVATSGDYDDLLNKPTLFSGDYDDLLNIPTTFIPSAHSHNIGDVTDLQNELDSKANNNDLANVATSGDYNDLLNKPDVEHLTFENGLREDNGVVKLGSSSDDSTEGLLVENVYLIREGDSDESISTLSIGENSIDLSSQSKETNHYSNVNVNGGEVLINSTHSIDNSSSSIKLNVNSIVIDDGINSKGFEYASDYSTNGKLDDRWIPDWGAVKGYVDENSGEASVKAISGDGVGGTNDYPILTFPTPQQINAATSEQGLLADTALQPIDAVDVAEAGKIVKYSNIGAVNTVLPQLPENAVNLEYLNLKMGDKVDSVVGMGLSEESFTSAEKLKLAGVEDPKFKGQYLSLADLLASGNGEVGGYAYVDNGVTIDMYIWDNTNEQWDIVVGESTAETPASIKSKYESNPDTNAFTDALKNKLEAFTANFTSTLKTAYDNAVSWISINGANILNHLSNKSNPHNVTAAQLGIVGLENLGKAWIPDYANMETTNRITSSGGGSWTSDRTGFIYVLSRGYNSGIYNTSVVYINEKEVGRVWVEATSGTGTARSGSFANTYPVKTGDVIKVYGNLETKCLFIPGVWV